MDKNGLKNDMTTIRLLLERIDANKEKLETAEKFEGRISKAVLQFSVSGENDKISYEYPNKEEIFTKYMNRLKKQINEDETLLKELLVSCAAIIKGA